MIDSNSKRLSILFFISAVTIFITFRASNKIKAEKQVLFFIFSGFGYGKKIDLDIGKNP